MIWNTIHRRDAEIAEGTKFSVLYPGL